MRCSRKVIFYLITGKYPQALAEYQEAIRRNPDVAKYYSNEGTAYIKLVDFTRARDCFDKALSKDSKYIKAYAKKADCHFFLKEYHKALETFEAGLKIDP
jgi:stress-induced-phosphoprotein 1